MTKSSDLHSLSMAILNECNRDLSPVDWFRLPRMYRIVLACKGVHANVGAVAARDITEEFTHRPWHQNVRCEWDGTRLMLLAENDFDSDGLALLDEFSDAISASIAGGWPTQARFWLEWGSSARSCAFHSFFLSDSVPPW